MNKIVKIIFIIITFCILTGVCFKKKENFAKKKKNNKAKRKNKKNKAKTKNKSKRKNKKNKSKRKNKKSKSKKKPKKCEDLSCKRLQLKTPEGKLKLFWKYDEKSREQKKVLEKKKKKYKKLYNCIEKNYKSIDKIINRNGTYANMNMELSVLRIANICNFYISSERDAMMFESFFIDIKLKNFLFDKYNNEIINCILKNINEPEIRKLKYHEFNELSIDLLKSLKGDCKNKKKKIKKILKDKLLNLIITNFVKIYLNIEPPYSLRLKPGDGVSEKEIEITDKINEEKGSFEFIEACIKQAKVEVFNGKKANGVTISNDNFKCFAEFGMKYKKNSNEYKTVFIGEPTPMTCNEMWSKGLTDIRKKVVKKGVNSTFYIPKCVTSINQEAYGYQKLKNVNKLVIPNSVTSIGAKAFAENKLESVVIPNSVTSIGKYAFYYNKLKILEIPNSVTSIGKWSFSGNKLKSITIPNSVTSIGEGAFWRNKLTSVVIPNSVKIIGGYAFEENELTSVEIPNSVTRIDGLAFKKNELTSVVIGNSVRTIGERAFESNDLTSVIIPNSVKSIGEDAFKYNNLTSVIIPNSVKSIGEDAFDKNVELIYKN